MKRWVNNVLAKSKQLVLPFLCAVIALQFAYSLSMLIVDSSTAFNVFNMIIKCGVFALMLTCWVTKKNKLFDLSFGLYFAWLFMNCLFGLPSMISAIGGGVLEVFYAIFALFILLSLLAIGVLYIINRYKDVQKYLALINWLCLIAIGLLFIELIFLIVLVAIDGWHWTQIFTILMGMALVLLFGAIANKDKEYTVQKKEVKKVEKVKAGQVEGTKVEGAQEEVKEEEKKEEAVVEQSQEEPVQVEDKPVAKTSTAKKTSTGAKKTTTAKKATASKAGAGAKKTTTAKTTSKKPTAEN